MDPFWTGIIGVILLVVLIMLRFPISFALASIGTLGLIHLYSFEKMMRYIPMELYSHVAKFTFTAVPLFLLMGYFAYNSGLTDEAFEASRPWVGWLPGGLALTTIGGCALFAACAGSSLAECAAMARIAVPEMRKSGYSYRLATGVVASAGSLSCIIPPSITLIIYGVITETSIGKLLIAGILPGILWVIVFSVAIISYAYLRPKSVPREKDVETSWKARMLSIKKVWGIGALFLLVICGIYLGLVTPTEAAALGAAGAMGIAIIKRKFNWGSFKNAILDTGKATSGIFLILGGASIFTMFMSVTGVVTSATKFLLSLQLSPLMLIICIFILYIVLGMFLDSISMMLLTLPLILPIIEAQGYSVIWFGILMAMLIEIGCITPPLGLNVYVIKGVLGDKVEMAEIFAGSIPFIALEILILGILYAFPTISLWLPNLMLE